jgi:hypothetical protein
LDYLCANGLYFNVGAVRDVVNEFYDGKFGAFAYNVLNVLTLDKLHLFYGSEDAILILSAFKVVPLPFFRLSEQHNPILTHQEFHEGTFFWVKQAPVLVFKYNHFSDFLVVVVDRLMRSCPIDDDGHPFLDIFKSCEALM